MRKTRAPKRHAARLERAPRPDHDLDATLQAAAAALRELRPVLASLLRSIEAWRRAPKGTHAGDELTVANAYIIGDARHARRLLRAYIRIMRRRFLVNMRHADLLQTLNIIADARHLTEPDIDALRHRVEALGVTPPAPTSATPQSAPTPSQYVPTSIRKLAAAFNLGRATNSRAMTARLIREGHILASRVQHGQLYVLPATDPDRATLLEQAGADRRRSRHQPA